MELLPVIYWSLFSVAVLALVVILFSFITFQFRKKYGNLPSEEVKGEERNKKVKAKNPDKKSKPTKKHHPKVQTRSKVKKSSSRNNGGKSKPEEFSLYKKPTKDSSRKRVEVLNPNPSDNSKSKEKFHSIHINSKRDEWN